MKLFSVAAYAQRTLPNEDQETDEYLGADFVIARDEDDAHDKALLQLKIMLPSPWEGHEVAVRCAPQSLDEAGHVYKVQLTNGRMTP